MNVLPHTSRIMSRSRSFGRNRSNRTSAPGQSMRHGNRHRHRRLPPDAFSPRDRPRMPPEAGTAVTMLLSGQTPLMIMALVLLAVVLWVERIYQRTRS